MGHARALLGARDFEALADQGVARQLSVRDTEKLAREMKMGRSRTATARTRSPEGPQCRYRGAGGSACRSPRSVGEDRAYRKGRDVDARLFDARPAGHAVSATNGRNDLASIAADSATAPLLVLPPLPAHAAAGAAATETRLPHISVVKLGHGNPVVLIPGLSSPRAVWDGVAPVLARTHTVYLSSSTGSRATRRAPILRRDCWTASWPIRRRIWQMKR